jgi:K+-transporting ATPase ATPase C chain
MIKSITIISFKILLLFTLITGIIYPLLVTIAGTVFFPHKASGSLVTSDGKIIGSELLGQKFENINYFHGRPSFSEYNTIPSSGSNLSIAYNTFKLKSDSLKNAFKTFNNTDDNIPSEMTSYSASGLDPHITKQSALMQADRISESRNFDNDKKDKLLKLINENVIKPQFGILGEERINVLLINLELDKLQYGK